MPIMNAPRLFLQPAEDAPVQRLASCVMVHVYSLKPADSLATGASGPVEKLVAPGANALQYGNVLLGLVEKGGALGTCTGGGGASLLGGGLGGGGERSGGGLEVTTGGGGGERAGACGGERAAGGGEALTTPMPASSYPMCDFHACSTSTLGHSYNPCFVSMARRSSFAGAEIALGWGDSTNACTCMQGRVGTLQHQQQPLCPPEEE